MSNQTQTLIEFDNEDEVLQKVLAHSKKPPLPKIDTSDRRYVTWFKLTHRFIQEVPGLPDFSFAQCSNPVCKSRTYTSTHCGGFQSSGAIANVNGLDMCRLCFMAGYGLTHNINPSETAQLTIDITDTT